MKIILIVLSITLAQIPGLIIRYLPFSEIVTPAQRKKLLLSYVFIFLLQNSILLLLLGNDLNTITPLTYKRMILVSAVVYFTANVFIMPKLFFRHLFVVSMQSGYTLFLHSLIAIIMSFIDDKLSLELQLITQTLLYSILFALITIPLWKHIKKALIYKYSSVQNYYWNIIWLIPAIAVYSDIILTMKEQWINTWPQVVSRFLTAIALVVSWKCINLDFEAIEKLQNLEMTNKLLHVQKEAILEHADILNDNEKKIGIYKHDMRHNLQILSSLIKSQNNSEALAYINNLQVNLQDTRQSAYCRNKIINAALLVYISKAEEHNISVITETDIPEEIPLNSNEIAVLLSNALENAVNASLRQSMSSRSIQISAKYTKNKLAIIIANKFSDKIEFSKSGFPITEAQGHGIGTQSMMSIIDKNNAVFSCSHENNWYKFACIFQRNDNIIL